MKAVSSRKTGTLIGFEGAVSRAVISKMTGTFNVCAIGSIR
jgi:hypothetical protein